MYSPKSFLIAPFFSENSIKGQNPPESESGLTLKDIPSDPDKENVPETGESQRRMFSPNETMRLSLTLFDL